MKLSALCESVPTVIPALCRNLANARLCGEKGLFSPKTWADWIPAQGRYNGSMKRREHQKFLASKARMTLRTVLRRPHPIKIALISFTLVSVGPVTMRSSAALKAE